VSMAADETVEEKSSTADSGSEFFNKAALVDETVESRKIEKSKKDEFGNPLSLKFDLGKAGSFKDFKLLFYPKIPRFSSMDYYRRVLYSLGKTLGFQLAMAQDDSDFVRLLPDYDEAWVISGASKPSKAMVEACKKHVESMKGLVLLTDDELNADANAVLDAVFGEGYGNIKGNDWAQGTLKRGSGLESGTFAKHPITTGIKNLFEGITVSHPDKDNLPEGMKVLATNTYGNPVMMYYDGEGQNKKATGRIVVDCGFTKLYDEHWHKTAGTDRYVRNIAVWILALEKRAEKGLPLQGAVNESN